MVLGTLSGAGAWFAAILENSTKDARENYARAGDISDEVMSSIRTVQSFGTEQKDWKPFRLFDGTECLVPGSFNVTPAPDGGWHWRTRGNLRSWCAAVQRSISRESFNDRRATWTCWDWSRARTPAPLRRNNCRQ